MLFAMTLCLALPHFAVATKDSQRNKSGLHQDAGREVFGNWPVRFRSEVSASGPNAQKKKVVYWSRKYIEKNVYTR